MIKNSCTVFCAVIIHSGPLYLSGRAFPARAFQLETYMYSIWYLAYRGREWGWGSQQCDDGNGTLRWMVDGKFWIEYRISLWFHFLYYPFTIFPINVILISNWIKMNRPFRFSCSSMQWECQQQEWAVRIKGRTDSNGEILARIINSLFVNHFTWWSTYS